VIWAAGQVFSFETAFMLFIFAAAYKGDPRFAWFPGDMTVAFFGLSAAAGLVPLLRGSLFYLPGIKSVFAGGILVLWIAASVAWSPSEIYAHEKLTLVAAGNLWCLICTAMIISSSRARVWRFLILLLVFGVVAAVDYAIVSAGDPAIQRIDEFRTISENYLTLGRLVGLAALVAFALWLRSPPRSMQGPLLLAAFALCGYVLLKGGGRNPAAAVAVGMLVPVLLSFRLPRVRLVIGRRILASLGLIVALGLGVTYLAMSGESSLRTLQRFDKLVSEQGGGRSAAERVDFWRHAVAYWAERPLVGHGVGAWPILYLGRDQSSYPHNLILELLVEFGLIGLVLFAALVLVATRQVSLQRLREDPALMCAVMLCINALVNAMSTGDLADNRNLFTMLGLQAMVPLTRPNKPAFKVASFARRTAAPTLTS
jgi:O-antigen ligase